MNSDAQSVKKKTLIGKKKKIAFVCSGGGVKAGAFHLGVALALQERGFKFVGGLEAGRAPDQVRGPMDITTYVGSSAGSIIASYLAAGYSLENIFNSFLDRKSDDPADQIPKVLPKLSYSTLFRLRPEIAKEQFKQFGLIKDMVTHFMDGNIESLLLFKMLKVTGLFTTQGLEEFLRNDVLPSNRFTDYYPELYIVSTQLNHSRKVVFGKRVLDPPPHDPTCLYIDDVRVSDACAASGALPLIYSPYQIELSNGKSYFFTDGEIRDTMSTHVAVDSGADLVIASYTHQPYHFTPEVGTLTDLGLPAILIQSLYQVIESKINNYIHGKRVQKNAIDAVSKYCKQQGLSDKIRNDICEIMEKELHHRMNVDMIYIHPDAQDPKMFIKEHFSLSPKKMSEIVRSGFRSAIEILRAYEFEDAPRSHA